MIRGFSVRKPLMCHHQSLFGSHLCTAALCLCSGIWWFGSLCSDTPRTGKVGQRGQCRSCEGTRCPEETAACCSRRTQSPLRRRRSGGRTPTPRQTPDLNHPPHPASASGTRWARSGMLSWEERRHKAQSARQSAKPNVDSTWSQNSSVFLSCFTKWKTANDIRAACSCGCARFYLPPSPASRTASSANCVAVSSLYQNWLIRWWTCTDRHLLPTFTFH